MAHNRENNFLVVIFSLLFGMILLGKFAITAPSGDWTTDQVFGETSITERFNRVTKINGSKDYKPLPKRYDNTIKHLQAGEFPYKQNAIKKANAVVDNLEAQERKQMIQQK